MFESPDVDCYGSGVLCAKFAWVNSFRALVGAGRGTWAFSPGYNIMGFQPFAPGGVGILAGAILFDVRLTFPPSRRQDAPDIRHSSFVIGLACHLCLVKATSVPNPKRMKLPNTAINPAGDMRSRS